MKRVAPIMVTIVAVSLAATVAQAGTPFQSVTDESVRGEVRAGIQGPTCELIRKSINSVGVKHVKHVLGRQEHPLASCFNTSSSKG